MRGLVISVVSTLALFGCTTQSGVDHAATPSSVKPRYFPVFPPLADGETQFVVTPEWAQGINAGILRFPDHARFSVQPGVTSISWTAQTIKIGYDAIFDLSPSLMKPATPAQPSTPSQADYCAYGIQGYRAIAGVDGQHGVDLTIGNAQNLENSGALWILTDGGPSGDSGRSGNGQQGGGDFGGIGGNPDLGGCHGKDGGRPGYGNQPGIPGRTSKVDIHGLVSKSLSECPGMTSVSDMLVQKSTKPPPEFQYNAGTISIYGSIGCRGRVGPSGLAGAHG